MTPAQRPWPGCLSILPGDVASTPQRDVRASRMASYSTAQARSQLLQERLQRNFDVERYGKCKPVA